MADVDLSITEQAQRTIQNMQVRVHEIADKYGENSDEHVKALRSLNQAFGHLFRLGGSVYRESDLSLLSVGFITYGVIFHPKYIDGNQRDPLLGDWSVHS